MRIGGQKTRNRIDNYKVSKGYISYGELDDLGSATGAKARLTKDMMGTGSKAKASIRPVRFEGQSANHARGHLIGKQLGCSGADPRNLTTLYQNPVNSPVMRDIENSVRSAVTAGEIVDYSVTPIYEGSELIARGMTIKAQGNRGFNVYQTILNRRY